jgi:2-hydroxycyclohexanecarboxyl-CoA dehydrogenase
VSSLAGRVALLTGSSDGIGFEIARQFAQQGARVILNGRNAERGAAALQRLGLAPERASFEIGDCTRHEDAERVAALAVERYGTIDILVASGAALEPPPMPFHELAPADFTRLFETQYLSRVFPIRAALPQLRAHGGSIIVVGTDAARHVTPGESIHGSMGAALILLTKALAREFSRWQIRVNGLALTLTSQTPTYDKIFAQKDFASGLFDKALQRFPRGSAPTVEEVGRVALFLASDASAQVTGQTISVNGGLSFGGW